MVIFGGPGTVTHKATRVLVLFLTFDREKKARVRKALSDFFSAHDALSFTVVEIDNADVEAPWTPASEGRWPCEAFQVGGDNRAHEFTGWDHGWREAQTHLPQQWDLVLVVNDALMNSKPLAALDALDADLIAQLAKQNTVLGWVDTFARVNPDPLDTIRHPMRLYGEPCRKWLCTTFFLAPAKIFAAISPMTSVTELDDLFVRTGAMAPFRADAPLSENYRKFLLDHQRRVWKRDDKRGYELNEETFDLFRAKVRNIVNEHRLGVKFWRTGVNHINLAIFDRRPRGLGLDTNNPPRNPLLRTLKLRVLSQWQLLREIAPPALERWRRKFPPRE